MIRDKYNNNAEEFDWVDGSRIVGGEMRKMWIY